MAAIELASGGRLAVLGLGYVGLPLAVRAAEVGWTVVGFDIDAGRVDRLVSGESYVEDIADDRLAPVAFDGSFTATSNPSELAGFDYAIITVPTPLRDGVPDSVAHRGSRPPCRPPRAEGVDGSTGIDELSGHDRRDGWTDTRGNERSRCGNGFLPATSGERSQPAGEACLCEPHHDPGRCVQAEHRRCPRSRPLFE